MLADEQLAAIERRWERVLARKEGRQEGNTGVVAMISAADVPDLLAEVKRLRSHSVALNTVAWRIAEALGEVPEGKDRIEGNPAEQVEKLIRQRDSLGRRCSARFGEMEDARADAGQARDERDEARSRLAAVRAETLLWAADELDAQARARNESVIDYTDHLRCFATRPERGSLVPLPGPVCEGADATDDN